MQGKRRYEVRTDEGGRHWYPMPDEGDYWFEENVGIWYCRPPTAPDGAWGSLAKHQVIEHDDETITVSPSILVEDGAGWSWHGYLRHGVWSNA